MEKDRDGDMYFQRRTLASEACIEGLMMQARKINKDHTFFKIIVGNFNAKIGPRRTAEELHIEARGMEWNEMSRVKQGVYHVGPHHPR
uniref:Reverse transcriptase n=1 Tax=Haemonchus contortus TaxID=6289 RepID=A0A7I4YU32_HAECO